MKKSRHLLALLLACIFVMCTATVNVTAAYQNYSAGDSAYVFVDNYYVNGINAYLDEDGVVRVSTHEDLLEIFKNDLDEGDIIVYSPDEGIDVEGWANRLGYYTTQDGDTLYISSHRGNTNNSKPSDRPNVTPSFKTFAKVFVNGLLVPETTVYIGNDDIAYVNNASDLSKLFSNGTANNFFSTISYSVKDWADIYGYTCVVKNDRVYLNNDGNSPVEIQINGKLINFPDQQPIIMRPGRTMVPVRTIAELVNCEVKYDSGRVLIRKSNAQLALWIGKPTYWLNGQYHEMDVSPYITNGRTMVPIRFVAEAFGYTVNHSTEDSVFTVKLT